MKATDCPYRYVAVCRGMDERDRTVGSDHTFGLRAPTTVGAQNLDPAVVANIEMWMNVNSGLRGVRVREIREAS